MASSLKIASLVLGTTLFLSSVYASEKSYPTEKNLRVGFSKIDITPYDVSKPFYTEINDADFENSIGPMCSKSQCYQTFKAAIRNPPFEHPAYQTPYGPIYIGGYAPYYPIPFYKNRWAVGVHDPVWARAVAIEGEDKKTVLLMSTDLPGLAWKYINPVRREIEKVFHIPLSNIVIASTHDHSGPDASGYWTSGLPGHQVAYAEQLKKWMLDAAVQAIRNLEPAVMTSLTTTHLACYNEKTHDQKREPDCHFPDNSTDYNGPNGKNFDQQLIQSDKRDPFVRNTMITVLHFKRPSNGSTIGTFINWHNHPDTMHSENLFISSDFPHYLREYVEGELGGTAVYFSGTLGCQIGPGSPVPRWTRDKVPVFEDSVVDSHGNRVRAFAGDNEWDKIRSIGYEIGSEVVKVVQDNSKSLAKSAPQDTLAIQVKTEPIDIAPANALHVLSTGSVWNDDVESKDKMHFYPFRCLGRWGCVRSDVSIMQIGDLSLITAPGEIDPVYFYGRHESTADYGGKFGKWHFPAMSGVKPLLHGPHYAVLGQANNYLSYLLPESDNVGPLNFKHPNHYEEFVTVNKHFGNDLGNKWMQMLGSSTRYNRRAIMPKAGAQ